MSKNNKDTGYDFITPFVEVFHDMSVGVVSVIFDLLKIAYKKWNKNYFELEKIEERHLHSNKKALKDNSIGYSANQKRELNLSEIDFSKGLNDVFLETSFICPEVISGKRTGIFA